MIWVFNSTPLIYLSKANLSWIFKELEGEKIIPKTVYDEVAEGKERGEIDAFLIDELVNKALKIAVVEPISLLKNVEELHRGEMEVLSLAKDKKGIAITDDSIAREMGEILGVKVHGTLYLIFLMVKKGKMDKSVAVNKVNTMIKHGFRLSAEVYSEFLRLLT